MAHLQKLYSMISSTLLFHNAILKAVFDVIPKECFFFHSQMIFYFQHLYLLIDSRTKDKTEDFDKQTVRGL